MCKGVTIRVVSSAAVDVLVVQVARHRLALLASAVDEVQLAALPTPLPGAPDIVEGVLDVRGDVLPVVEVRRRLGMASRPVALDDCLVVTRANGRRLVLRVDDAVTVTQVQRAELVPDPRFVGAAYVDGTGTDDDGLLVLLDVGRFLTEGDTSELHAALAAATPMAR